MSRWRRLLGQDDQVDPGTIAPLVDEFAEILQQLDAVMRRVRSSSGRVPPVAVVRAHDVGDAVRQLVRELARRRNGSGSVDALVVVTLESTVTDYLPTSVDSFLAVADHGGLGEHAAQRKAEEQLCAQLELLSNGVLDMLDSVHNGTSNPLDVQGRFLQAKFGRDDLTL